MKVWPSFFLWKPLNVLFMKTTLLLIIGFIFCSSISAQSYLMNWNSSFSSGWANGATNGNAFNVGGSGINCSVNITKSGGAFASFSGPMTPTVSSSIVVGGSSANLQVALDYATSSDYTDITFTFSSLVYDLNFNIADIDRLTNSSNSYYDRITVSGTMGALTIQPVITKYDAVSDPGFLMIASNVARVNTASGMAGNTASDASDQKGTIKVSFGGKAITSFTMRYDNYTGVAADPGLQFIGIGNISFFKSWPLSVQLTSFDCEKNKGKNMLKWKTANEDQMAYYAIERSKNGKDFSESGQVASINSVAASEYSFSDNSTGTGAVYYRLKMVNNDGSFTYSKIVFVPENSSDVKIFPTVFTSSLTVHMSSPGEELMQVRMIDLSGKTVYQQKQNLNKGTNEFSMQPPAQLAKGQYFVVLGNSNQSFALIRQ
jgi:hypothetical protein